MIVRVIVCVYSMHACLYLVACMDAFLYDVLHQCVHGVSPPTRTAARVCVCACVRVDTRALYDCACDCDCGCDCDFDWDCVCVCVQYACVGVDTQGYMSAGMYA